MYHINFTRKSDSLGIHTGGETPYECLMMVFSEDIYLGDRKTFYKDFYGTPEWYEIFHPFSDMVSCALEDGELVPFMKARQCEYEFCSSDIIFRLFLWALGAEIEKHYSEYYEKDLEHYTLKITHSD